jgi:toxin ParE1/3/4
MAYVGLSRRASLDIAGIREFSVEKWGEKVAEDYLDEIERALSRLSQRPNLLRTKHEFSPHFRFYRVQRHFLVCSLIQDNVYVLAVRHCSMDLPNRLAELEPNLLEEADLLHNLFLAKMSKERPTR